ncbi:MAG TPA: hypothetical protein VKZ50_17950 [bacterium]|nr:hypothetical protein [bacterium]
MHWNSYAYEVITKERIGAWREQACSDRLARAVESGQVRGSALLGRLARLLGVRPAARDRALAAVVTKPCGATGDGRAA